MRALVTGGAGFLGFHLARSLVESGYEVVLVDNMARGQIDQDLSELMALDAATLVETNLEVLGALDSIPGTFDEVYHLAAVLGVRHVMADPARVMRVNARTLLNLVDFFQSRDHGRFFFASTSEVYAWTAKIVPLPIPTPEAVPLAVDDVGNRRASYALSKIFGEMVVLSALGDTENRYVTGRLHNVFGPRMGSVHVVPELYLRMRGGEDPLRVVEAQATRAFCYVKDAVDAIRHLMAKAPNGIYNIGNDAEEIRIGDLATKIAIEVGFPSDLLDLGYASEPAIARRCPSIDKLRAVGFSPRVSLSDGIRSTLEWYGNREHARGV